MRFVQKTVLAILGVAAVVAPLQVASARTPDGFSFTDLEYRNDAGDAERLGKEEVAKLVQPGMSSADAVAILRKAGTYCRPHEGDVTCLYTAMEAVEEMPHDLVWTVKMDVADGRVTTVTTTRESLGS